MHESQMHEANSFLTLTYSDENLPANQSVDVEDWKLFAKRTRKRLGSFRYLHCGEYGDQTQRPHYHACVFGLDFSHDRKAHTRTPSGHPLYTSPTLDDLWGKGHALIGTLTFDSAAYVAAYTMKRATGDLAEEKYSRLDENGNPYKVKPEYATMSRRPGIGSTWFDRYVDEVYPDDYVVAKGRKLRPPKYYDDLLEERNPELMERVKRKRLEHVGANAADNTPARQKVKEKVLDSKLNLAYEKRTNKLS